MCYRSRKLGGNQSEIFCNILAFLAADATLILSQNRNCAAANFAGRSRDAKDALPDKGGKEEN